MIELLITVYLGSIPFHSILIDFILFQSQNSPSLNYLCCVWISHFLGYFTFSHYRKPLFSLTFPNWNRPIDMNIMTNPGKVHTVTKNICQPLEMLRNQNPQVKKPDIVIHWSLGTRILLIVKLAPRNLHHHSLLNIKVQTPIISKCEYKFHA